MVLQLKVAIFCLYLQIIMEIDGLFEENQGSNEKTFDGVEHDEKQLEGGYFTWPRQMDTLLLEVLREQKIKGLKDDRNFQGEAYTPLMPLTRILSATSQKRKL